MGRGNRTKDNTLTGNHLRVGVDNEHSEAYTALMQADQQLLAATIAEYVEYNGPYLCHVTGTDPEVFQTHGFCPDYKLTRFHAGTREQHRTDLIYFGSEEIVSGLYKDTEHQHIVKVNINDLDPNLMHADARVFFWTDYTEDGGSIVDVSEHGLPDPLKTVGADKQYQNYGQWAADNLAARRAHWAALSLGTENVVAYAGSIKPAHLTFA